MMLTTAVLLAAFTCSAWSKPIVVTDPSLLYSTWNGRDYNSTRDTLTGEATVWAFNLEGTNGVPQPGPFATSCRGVQTYVRIPVSSLKPSPPDFVPCDNEQYAARQYFVFPDDAPSYTAVEVQRTVHPDLGKTVLISAFANYTTFGDIAGGDLTFGDFQTEFVQVP
ncbi:hypothetical protein PVAG01_11360 [Phlyctema vagabunda]|uniref:Uncharacterized protein n=1 Tax=Phlyctema vagabunda TaxID=108571 RepID=A0ABR4P224_9HELO